MSATMTELKNLRELRDFLNSQPDEVLDDKIRFISYDEQIHNINEVAILEEDFINPTGECYEPISHYKRRNEPLTEEELAREPRVGFKGQFYFVI